MMHKTVVAARRSIRDARLALTWREDTGAMLDLWAILDQELRDVEDDLLRIGIVVKRSSAPLDGGGDRGEAPPPPPERKPPRRRRAVEADDGEQGTLGGPQ